MVRVVDTKMPPADIKQARQRLGLSVRELATLLDTDESTIRKMGFDPSARQFRRPAPRMVRLIRAYLDGYRPPDWPVTE